MGGRPNHIATLLGGALSVASAAIVLCATPAVALDVEDLAALLPADAATADDVGISVAISGDLALVGAYQLDTVGTGAAYAFQFDGTDWTQIAKLTASNGVAGARFGEFVALDGNRAVIGAPAQTGGGAAYYFDLSSPAATMTETAQLSASGLESDGFFGTAVAIDGTIAVVADSLDDIGSVANIGSVYVYDLTSGGSVIADSARLSHNASAFNDQFGTSVAIDGPRIAIGALGRKNPAGLNSGGGFVFENQSGTWVQVSELTASDAATDDRLGRAVDISGTRVVLGAHRDDTAAGGAYLYDVRIPSALTQEDVKLQASDRGDNHQFGRTVAIDGDQVLVGARLADRAPGERSGKAYLFDNIGAAMATGGIVTEDLAFIAETTGLNDWFGYAVDLDGGRAIVGAPLYEDADGVPPVPNTGGAFVFGIVDVPTPAAAWLILPALALLTRRAR